MIKAFDHEFIAGETYAYDVDKHRLDDDEINGLVQQYCPDLMMLIEKAEQKTRTSIIGKQGRMVDNMRMSAENKAVYLKNLELIEDYIIQRNINKTAYYCMIRHLAESLKSSHIEYIVVPMSQTFIHVLHSVQGVLRRRHFPIESTMETFIKNGQLFFKLKIINR